MKKARINSLYIRKDPDSTEAYYEIEDGSDTSVGCPLTRNNKNYEFIWQRLKSNENLEHGFTHYLTRWAYTDKFRVINCQENGNIGLLCALQLDRFGYKNEERGIPEEVLLCIRQEKEQDGRIRLITCYSTNNLKYIELYVNNFIDRQRFNSKSHDFLDKKDFSDKNFKNITEKKESSMKLIEHIIKQNKNFYIEHFKKGYQIFQKIINRH